jgi:hypothetical protein
MIECPKFVEMQKMFQGKKTSRLEGQVVAKVKTVITNVNVIDIKIATINIITKD